MALASHQSRRRWSRFGLRSLFIVVGLACVWIAIRVNDARRQRRAVGELQALDVVVDYGFHENGQRTGPRGPKWLRNLIGVDYFDTVTFVSVFEDVKRDSDLAAIADLKGLEVLCLGQSGVGSETLTYAQNLPKLITVTLGGNNATDKSLRHLANMSRLEVIQIGGENAINHVTNSGLAHVANLTNLKRLDLYGGAQITDEGLANLYKLRNLRQLTLTGTGVTDDGVAKLKGVLPNCRILRD